MASIAQKSLFCWQDIEELGDLKRLKLVLDSIPDEGLMKLLEERRGCGRNDYPVRAVWNSLLAMVVFGHGSIASLRRELRRNAQLRAVCGFDLMKGLDAVPSAAVYSRFLKVLLDYSKEVYKIFSHLTRQCAVELEGYGESLAIDGKALPSYGRNKGEGRSGDRRREEDADWGVREYSTKGRDGKEHKSVKKWHGFRLHTIIDTRYELPVEFEVTRGSESEVKYAHRLLDRVDRDWKSILERAKFFSADRGYDDGKLIKRLWDDYGIKPVIGIRNCWKDRDETKVVPGYENVVYDYRGRVQCVCPAMGRYRDMAYGGFEKGRGTLKYRCPARHYGYECEGEKRCGVKGGIRIKLRVDRRVFTPLARSSYRWKRVYKRRNAVERLHSRLDTSFGFENHTIRGLKKMSLLVKISYIVMLSMALGRKREKQDTLIRSLVSAA